MKPVILYEMLSSET